MIHKKYLNKLNNIEKLSDFIDEIKKIYIEFDNNEYIPALIEEGDFTQDDGEDFYLKLILKHHDIPIKRTWLKNNFLFGLSEPSDDDSFIHNIIVYRNYKSRKLYQVNPLITNDEGNINEYEYENSTFVNCYYNDEYSSLKGKPILRSNDDIKLLLLKDVLKNYINDPNGNTYPKYELVIEFEYRTHNIKLKDIENKDYRLNSGYLKIDVNKSSGYILGSILIPFKNNSSKEIIRNVRVVDLMTLRTRTHNPKNYNGDINEGLVYFKKDIINIIKKSYYIYNLQIIDKKNIDNKYLIDILDDKIMFFEGEYNKLPSLIKEKIDIYNFVPSQQNNMISEAMKAWQLDCDWNWEDKLLPNYKLASLIRKICFNRATDLSLSFEIPNNKQELREFIIKIEKLTTIKLESFDTRFKDVSKLILIRDDLLEYELKDFKIIYLKYCYSIWEKYNDRH